MSQDVAIKVEHLYKQYGLPLPPVIRNIVNRVRGKTNYEPLWSLRDVNFEVKKGETLGILGYNGAGKSTLLKILAGVTPPTQGSVELRGRVFPMIELNAGMSMDLTGRENVQLLGILMGMSHREIKSKLPEIEEFCELGNWFDEPVWKYSSGMLARLGFAAALNVDADILLVDEVLAVGDITFQRKSLDRMEKVQKSGKTVLFVSHNIRQLERLCDRALLLDKGYQITIGSTTEVVAQYYESTNILLLENEVSNGESVSVLKRPLENAVIEIIDMRLYSDTAESESNFFTGQHLNIELDYIAHEDVEHPVIAITILTIDMLHVATLNNGDDGYMMFGGKKGTICCSIPALPLLNGIYTLNIKIIKKNGSIIGGGSGLAIFSVTVPEALRIPFGNGLVGISSQWSHLTQN